VCVAGLGTLDEKVDNMVAQVVGLVPAISRLSTEQLPDVAVSSPANTLSTVVLPQPEWPMMQTNSPLSMAKLTSANTGLMTTKALLNPSTFKNLGMGRFALPFKASMASFNIGHHFLQLRKREIQQHARDANH
jgi:hypothetical protein